MFTSFAERRPRKVDDRVRDRYLRLLEEARDLQRKGDIRSFADRPAEAELAGREPEAVQRGEGGGGRGSPRPARSGPSVAPRVFCHGGHDGAAGRPAPDASDAAAE
jgi:hypothetical protein